jgi:hypothetical protein
MNSSRMGWEVVGLAGMLVALTGPASADVVVTANDSHSVNVNGVLSPAKNAPPDSVSIIDVSAYPPKLVATVDAPRERRRTAAVDRDRQG